jgi:RNA polymerase sigma factor (sigma-70 family)
MASRFDKDIQERANLDQKRWIIPASDSDQPLWNAFRNGESYALGMLSKKYYRLLFHYATRFTQDAAFIEDCIQDVFLHLWNRRTNLGDTASIKFYLLKSLRHHLIKKLHKNPFLESLEEWNTPIGEEEHAESKLIEVESLHLTRQKLHHFLDVMPKRQREALYLRYYEDLSYEQISQLMGIHAQSVANLLQHSLKKLRQLWHASKIHEDQSFLHSSSVLPMKERKIS